MAHPFVEIADRCFVARHRQWDVSVGLVAGSGAAMVIDTRGSRQQGEEIVSDVQALGLGVPITSVVNTHVHFDHSFGNAAIPTARVLAHASVGRRWRDDEARIKAVFRADPCDARLTQCASDRVLAECRAQLKGRAANHRPRLERAVRAGYPGNVSRDVGINRMRAERRGTADFQDT